MRSTINTSPLVIATVAIAVLAAAFWIWSDTGPERSEAANEQAKTEMHIEIDGTLGAGAVHCDSRTQSTCKLNKGSTFTVHIVPSAIPVGGYAGFQTRLEYGSLLYKPSADKEDELVFPDGKPGTLTRGPSSPTGKEGAIVHSAYTASFPDPVTGVLPVSFQKTTLVDLAFNCAENGQTPGQSHSSLMRLADIDETLSGSVFVLENGSTLSVPNVSGLTIECNPPPTKQPDPGDSDLDGCSDEAENGALEYLGGQRDYLYFWDFYDVWTRPPGDPNGWERNKVLNIFDIHNVGFRFGPGPVLSKADALAQALVAPTDATGYHPAYDRGPIIGANMWDRGPPDGSINIVDDILGIAQQFGHNCA